jgi:hypothetical protein
MVTVSRHGFERHGSSGWQRAPADDQPRSGRMAHACVAPTTSPDISRAQGRRKAARD